MASRLTLTGLSPSEARSRVNRVVGLATAIHDFVILLTTRIDHVL